MSDPTKHRARTAIAWLVTLAVLAFMVYMSVNRAMVEEQHTAHTPHSQARISSL